MPAALEQVRVLDLSDDRAIYAGKLLGDLGAQVLRLEPPDGDPLRRRGPHMNGQLDGESLWHAFFASSRTMRAPTPTPRPFQRSRSTQRS